MSAIADTDALQKITAALAVFSTSTDKQQIASANEWLQDYQHTVSHSLLGSANNGAELEMYRSGLGRHLVHC